MPGTPGRAANQGEPVELWGYVLKEEKEEAMGYEGLDELDLDTSIVDI